jgi:hypothetical protein
VVRPVVVAVAGVPGSIVVDGPVLRDTMMVVTNMIGAVGLTP